MQHLLHHYKNAETEQELAEEIAQSDIYFKKKPWLKVSDNAKDLVKKMLDPDPKRRLTAQEVLGKMQFM
jgi:calcium-dependent protein kinase